MEKFAISRLMPPGYAGRSDEEGNLKVQKTLL
jgi:hypothetical protein